MNDVILNTKQGNVIRVTKSCAWDGIMVGNEYEVVAVYEPGYISVSNGRFISSLDANDGDEWVVVADALPAPEVVDITTPEGHEKLIEYLEDIYGDVPTRLIEKVRANDPKLHEVLARADELRMMPDDILGWEWDADKEGVQRTFDVRHGVDEDAIDADFGYEAILEAMNRYPDETDFEIESMGWA